MQKYLIIGGAGFIGSHLSEELLGQGNKIVIIDNASIKITSPKIKSYKISIDDRKKVFGIFKKEKPDFVFHLAGAINLRRPIEDPLFIKDIDFLSRTAIILEACKENNVKKIVFVSSGGAIYENAKIIPTKEDYFASPNSLYGSASLMIEKYIALYCNNHAMHFTIPRVSNVYGPRQWQSGFIPATITKLLKKESPVIFGTGNQTRDFIYISDLVEALIILVKKGKNEIYNVGSGKEITLKKVFAEIKSLSDSNISATYKNAKISETQRSVMNIKKIQKEFNWSPKTNFTQGLLKTIEWHKDLRKNG